MRDKHLHIEADSQLLKLIYQRVEKELTVHPGHTRILLTIKFLFYFTILSILYTAIYYIKSSGWLIIDYIGFGVVAVLMGFNFAHDFSHNTVFRNKTLNHFCFVVIYTLLGAHAEAWKQRHIHSHHYAPNVKDYDSDLQITHLIRVEPTCGLKWFHRYQHWYAPFAYTTYSLYWVFVKDFAIYFSDRLKKWRSPGYHISFWTQKVIYLSYLLILPLLYSPLPAGVILSAFLLMHLVQSVFLLFTFFMTHHVESTLYFDTGEEGYINTSWLNNQVRSSNDFFPFSRTANFIFGGFNNHIAHHLFPHIHHVHYPALNRILYQTLRENGIEPNVTSYLGGIQSHLRYLRKMSRRGV